MSTLVNVKKESPLMPSFSSLIDEFFGTDHINKIQLGTTIPAVNVLEAIQHFDIEMAVPGMKKEDFKLELLPYNILLISAETEKEEENKDEKGQLTRREYNFSSFSRSFTLPEHVDTAAITAGYEDGILKIHVPKLVEDAVKNSKKITVK